MKEKNNNKKSNKKSNKKFLYLRTATISIGLVALLALILTIGAFAIEESNTSKHLKAGVVENVELETEQAVPRLFSLKGEASLNISLGETYIDPGVKAWDEYLGDISENVFISSNVDSSQLGSYEVSYSLEDVDGNTLELIRVVNVVDLDAPVISLAGDSIVYLKLGENYTDPGFSASDNYDGDLTANVTSTNNIDTSKIGVYNINYSVTDSSNNTGTATRKIYVYQQQTLEQTRNPGNKVVYLTFDDGPYKYTSSLLDVLDKYNVKATFFVTNQYPAYQYLIAEEARRGHTVAIHSYSHKYSEIYSSEEAYFNDLNAMREIIINQTGKAPSIVRFPGGTDNTVSRHYNIGIMSRLTSALSNMGYRYCDWNVSSGDAGGVQTRDSVYNNVTTGIANRNVSVVLQHDIKGFSVDAVEDIIVWGLANGYTFLPLDTSSPMVHSTPAN